MAFFQCKYAFSNENMTFYINKRRRKTPYTAFSMQIRLFICLSEGVGCRQYVLNFKYFWIRSKGGGSEFFNNFWNSKYSEQGVARSFLNLTRPYQYQFDQMNRLYGRIRGWNQWLSPRPNNYRISFFPIPPGPTFSQTNQLPTRTVKKREKARLQ